MVYVIHVVNLTVQLGKPILNSGVAFIVIFRTLIGGAHVFIQKSVVTTHNALLSLLGDSSESPCPFITFEYFLKL